MSINKGYHAIISRTVFTKYRYSAYKIYYMWVLEVYFFVEKKSVKEKIK